MAWNEPGKGRNPWEKKGGNQGPPDLDEIVKNLQRRVGSLFGGRGGGGSGSVSGWGAMGLGLIMVLVVLVWGLTGIYELDASERGVVLRFGKYHATTMPGLHWHIPQPIEHVEKVNVTGIETFSLQVRMLTADENIVEIDLAVQFRRADARDYLFNIRNPAETLRDVTESAIREVVGKSDMDFVLREGRTEIALRTEELMQRTLDFYGAGIVVTKVNLQDANFPQQVQASVQDAIKAREDKERFILRAQEYVNDILPKARGAASRQTLDAEGYRARVIADAEGEASRFLQLLAEYQLAKEVTRERLYLETMEQVFRNTTKVLLDAGEGGNLVYLPVDKLLEKQAQREPMRGSALSPTGATPNETQAETRVDRRTRGSR